MTAKNYSDNEGNDSAFNKNDSEDGCSDAADGQNHG